MAKKEKEIKTEETGANPQIQAMAYLKENKNDHYNFEEDNYYKVPNSSLNLNLEIGGGLPVGAHRAVGINSGGKTSCTLDFMLNFLRMDKKNKGIYFKCEGRLSPEIQERSGIQFTSDPEKWDNNCLVFESNVYEAVFGFIRELIVNNPTKNKYFFIIDSMDNLVKRDDLAKPLEEAGQVAGGALLTSVFLKKTALALSKRGHILFFISQLRDEIKINAYQKTNPRQGGASGGHAVEHGASLVFEFLPRWQDDYIREGPEKTSKIIGHKCKIRLVKTDNEKYQVDVSYPIKYGRTGGTSVWQEREVYDQLLSWNLLKKGGAWFNFSQEILNELREIDKDVPEKIQGEQNVCNFLESNPKITSYLYDKFRNTLMTG